MPYYPYNNIVLQFHAQVYGNTSEHPQDVKTHDAASTRGERRKYADGDESRAEEVGEGEEGRQKGARMDSMRIVEMASEGAGVDATGIGGGVGTSEIDESEGPEQHPPSMSDDEKTEEVEKEKGAGGEGVADAGASKESREVPGAGMGWKEEDPEDLQIFSEYAKQSILSQQAEWDLQSNPHISPIGASATALATSSTPVPAFATPGLAAAASGGDGEMSAPLMEAADASGVADYFGEAFEPRINHEFKAVKCVCVGG